MLKKGDIVELKVRLMFSGYKGKAVRLHKPDDEEFIFKAMRYQVTKKQDMSHFL